MANELRWTREQFEAHAKRRLAWHAEAEFAKEMADLKPLTRIGSAAAHPVPSHIAGRLYPLVLLCREYKIPEPRPEYQFHPTRGWRFDYAWIYQKVAVEIDGGVFTGGRHTRGKGFIEDQRKLNAATLLGWRCLRYTPDRLGEAIDDLKELLR